MTSPTPHVGRIDITPIYTGANGAALVANLPGVTILSDNGTTMVVTHVNTGPVSVAIGDRMIMQGNSFSGLCAASIYGDLFRDFGALTSTAVTAAAATLGPVLTAAGLKVRAGGPLAVPASVLGQTQNYDVTLTGTAMSNTSYIPWAQLRGAPNIVSGHGILAVTALSATQVRVQVQSGAASLAGANVHVLAIGT